MSHISTICCPCIDVTVALKGVCTEWNITVLNYNALTPIKATVLDGFTKPRKTNNEPVKSFASFMYILKIIPRLTKTIYLHSIYYMQAGCIGYYPQFRKYMNL